VTRFAPTLLASLLAALVAVGCTFNVQAFVEDVPRSESGAGALDRLRVDLDSAGSLFDGSAVVVRGAEREGAAADVRIGGLVGAGEDRGAIVDGIRIDWPVADDGAHELVIGYDGPTAETVWVERLAIELPRAAAIEVIGGAGDVDIAGVDGLVRASAGSGSILVRDAGEVELEAGSGSIDVIGARGSVTTGSGSTQMALEGAVFARAGSGSIRGSFDGGCDIETGSGSIVVDLATAFDGDSRLVAGSGSIILSVPADAGFELEIEVGSGGVSVDAGGVSHHGGRFTGSVGGGGAATVRMQTGSGSIIVTERDGA
jgi:hypothetical protein